MLTLATEEWISVCAVADTYGFAPLTQPWHDAKAGMTAREGKVRGMEWWNESIFLVNSFSAEEQGAFLLALRSAEKDGYARVEKEIASGESSTRVYALQSYLRTSFRHLLHEVTLLSGQGCLAWKSEPIGMKQWIFHLFLHSPYCEKTSRKELNPGA